MHDNREDRNWTLPATLAGLAIGLFGAERIEAPAKAFVAEDPPARVAPLVPGAGPKAAPAAEFDAAAHMSKIEAAFDDGLERKRLLVTLGPGQRSDLAHHADRFMQAHPPGTFEEQLKWQRHLCVLRACDPCLAAGYDRAERESLKGFLAGLDGWKTSKSGLRDLDVGMRRLHKLMGALSTEGQESCTAKMLGIEAELSKRGDAVQGYIKASLAVARKDGISARASSQDAIHRGGSTPVLSYFTTGTLHSELGASRDFKSDGKRWLFVEKLDEKLGKGKSADWVVELDSMYLRLVGGRYVTLRATSDAGMFVSMSEAEFRTGVKAGTIDAKVKEARRTIDLETRHAETLKAYDLPKEGKLGYLRVFPDNHDQVVSAAVQSSVLLSAALEHRYGERMERMAPLFTANPRAAIIAAIEKARPDGKGPAFFCVDIYNHGSPTEVCFDYPLTASDLTEIAERFPDCRFAFSTIACHGGGLREGLLKELEKAPELKGRVALFLQTKPNMPNYLASTGYEFGGGPYNSTNYNLHLTEALYDPKCKTFGEAVRRADLKTKEYMSLDAESVVDGILIGRAKNELADLIA